MTEQDLIRDRRARYVKDLPSRRAIGMMIGASIVSGAMWAGIVWMVLS